MINKTWTTLLNVSGADLRYRQIPGGYLADPDYRPARGPVNRRFDEVLYGTTGEPYYRVWKARACMRLLYECELIGQIEDAASSYDLDDTAMFWDVWGNRVSPSGPYKTILEVYGEPVVDTDAGVIHRCWYLHRDANQLTVVERDNGSPLTVPLNWTGASSQMFTLPGSAIQVRVYRPDDAEDAFVQDWQLESLGKPTFDLAGLHSDINGCGTDVGPVLIQTIKDIGLQDAWERHPLVWVRAAVGLAAICQIRTTHG